MNSSYQQKRQQRLELQPSRITEKMNNFLMILLNDCGFGSSAQRNAYLSRKYGRHIKFIDELTFSEGSKLIDELMAQRSEQQTKKDDDE